MSINDISSNDYFDLGSWNSWNLMNWSSGTINQQALNNYIDSYVAQAKAEGLSQVTLSFAQVCDIQKMIAGNFGDCSSEDALEMLSKNTNGQSVGRESVLQYMAQRLHADGLNVFLSFGGAIANSKDWDFGFGTQNPEDLGKSLANWAHQCGFSGIDFDMEDGAGNLVSVNGAANLAQFFSSLHQTANSFGMSTTLTVMGDAGIWGPTGKNFGAMFSQGSDITHMFDGINLMLYNGQYYINAGQQPPQSWDLTNWIAQLQQNTGMSPGDCASFLHIGFNSAVDYSKASSSGGPLPYDPTKIPPNVKTSGQFAAWILQQVQQELRGKYGDPTLTFGTSFFWDNKANYSVDPNNNYQSQFFQGNSFEQDFYAWQKLALHSSL